MVRRSGMDQARTGVRGTLAGASADEVALELAEMIAVKGERLTLYQIGYALMRSLQPSEKRRLRPLLLTLMGPEDLDWTDATTE
jgi:hypothetical protein